MNNLNTKTIGYFTFKDFYYRVIKQFLSVAVLLLFVSAAYAQAEIEPNNSFSTANPMTVGVQATGVVCAGDIDYFKTKFPTDGTIKVYVEATNTGSGNGYFYIQGFYKNQQDVFGQRTSANNIASNVTAYDTFYVNCMAADSFYFKVSQALQCFSYKIKYDVITQSTNDAEPNDDFSNAIAMNVSTQVQGHIGYVANGIGDEFDYYKTKLPADGTLKVYVEATNTGSGNGYFYVTGYDKRQAAGPLFDQTSANNVAPGSVTFDTITVNCLAVDSFYFRIRRASQCFSYKIKYEIVTQSTNDAEGNDDFTTALPMVSGTQVVGHIGYQANGIGDEYDYYKTKLPADGILKVYVEATNTGSGNGYFYVTGYDKRQAAGQLFDQTSANNVTPGSVTFDTITVNCLAVDSFYFRIRRAYQCFSYKIKYEIVNQSTNDIEVNDDFTTAIPMSAGNPVVGHIGYQANGIGDEYDYYKTVLPSDGILKVYVQATNTGSGNGYFYVTGYDRRQGAGTLFDRTSANNVTPGSVTLDTFQLYCVAKDTFYFRIRRAYQCFSYSLKYEMIGPATNDAEPNNDFATAMSFTIADTVKGHIGAVTNGIGDDYDYYKTVLPADGTMRVYVEATNTGPGNGYFYITGYDRRKDNGQIFDQTSANNVTAGSVTIDSFDVNCIGADTFYFRIRRAYQCFAYKFSYKIMGLSIVDPESNNNFSQAMPLANKQEVQATIGRYTAGVGDDNDFYKVALPLRGTGRIYIQATNTGNGNGNFYLNVYNRSQANIFNKTIANNVVAGSTTYDTINLYCLAADTFYFNISRAYQCFSYKISYELTLGADTTVFVCPGFTTNIGTLYNLRPFVVPTGGFAKYENMASQGTYLTSTVVGAGTYRLSVYNGTDDCSRDTAIIIVANYPKPNPAFTINNTPQCFNGNSFTFTNTSTISAGSMTYQWNFGDNTSSTLTNPVHSYSIPGVFNVKLVATSNNGCKDSVTISVTVNPSPAAGFTINAAAQCVNSNSFTFTNTSTIGSGGTFTSQWNFGDNTTSTAITPTHTYATAGTYNVKLVVTSNSGCKDSVTQSITVNPKPAPAFTINNTAQPLSNNNFIFTNTSTISSGTITYVWNFGDNTTLTTTSPTHTYTTAGTFNVKLVATSNNGCKDSVTQSVTVVPSYYSKSTGNLEQLSTWGTNTDGSGTSPLDFTSPNQVFNIRNNPAPIIGGDWLIGGVSSRLLVGDGTAPLTFTISASKVFTINNSAGLLVQNNASIVFNPASRFVIGTGSIADFNSKSVTLKSDVTGTANLSQILGVLNNATNVTAERYISNRRAWRLLGIPFSASAQTIKAAWQEGATSITSNPVPGYGTHITTYSGDPNAANFDAIKAASSIRTYFGDAFTSDAAHTPNTLNNITANPAYFLFVRGDRALDRTFPGSATSATTLRMAGTIKQGNVSGAGITGSTFSLIPNPYPSPLDFDAIKAISPNSLINTFYVWDATLGTVGQYRTIQVTGAGPNYVYTATPGTADNNWRFIESGTAFFVPGNISVNFTEATKSAGTPPSSMLRTVTTKETELVINLNSIDGNNNATLADGIREVFDNNYSSAIDQDDSKKLSGFDLNLGIVSNIDILAVEKRPLPKPDDVISLKLWNSTPGNYQFEIQATNFPSNLKAYLFDNYLNTRTAIDGAGAIMTNFIITSDTASAFVNRFSIVFTNPAVVDIKPAIVIYPNPTNTGNITLQFNNMPKGKYNIKVSNALGQVVISKQIEHAGGSNLQMINISKVAGAYLLEVNKPDNTKFSGKVIIN